MIGLKQVLAHPASIGVDLDSPDCTEARKEIIQSNGFLHRIYEAWYGCHKQAIPDSPIGTSILEIGSGAGFFAEFMNSDEVVTSDIIPLSGIDLTLDAQELEQEFAPESLRGITMINVLHHVPDVRRFFRSATQALAPGGVVSMIEPWVSGWSKFVYNNLHHEPFDPGRPDWGFETTGPLSGANGALPWIVFERDKQQFEEEFPELNIVGIQPIMPLLYLISGGVSMRQLQPAALFGLWSGVEKALSPWRRQLAMFAHIVVQKK
tara:strand:+ start:1201 stop:1992 length:792 start_codon:yes stop_codon:yes gene_type:complete